MKKLFARLYEEKNKIYWRFARLKTILWYRLFFGHIGRGSTFFKPMLLTNPENVFLAERVVIRQGSRIETIYTTRNHTPKFTIGGGTSIEQFMHVGCAQCIKIGREVVISADVYITDVEHEYCEVNKNVGSQPLLTKSVQIGDYCFIGKGAKIFPGTVLGKGCVVGANTIVRGVYPEHCVLVGAPAKVIKRYDRGLFLWRRTDENGKFLE